MAPLLVAVDAVVVKVPDLDAGLRFYRDSLGHQVAWRTDRMAGLGLAGSETELVLSLDVGPETDLLVMSVQDAVRAFAEAGGSIVAEPADIPVGRVAVVRDPFGTELTLVDLSKGRYKTDRSGRVSAARHEKI
ncbi:MAG: VOC family protein [Chloroflexi bacterium]|nr:VOC family protein [Chloroflexota bacterium]